MKLRVTAATNNAKWRAGGLAHLAVHPSAETARGLGLRLAMMAIRKQETGAAAAVRWSSGTSALAAMVRTRTLVPNQQAAATAKLMPERTATMAIPQMVTDAAQIARWRPPKAGHVQQVTTERTIVISVVMACAKATNSVTTATGNQGMVATKIVELKPPTSVRGTNLTRALPHVEMGSGRRTKRRCATMVIKWMAMDAPPLAKQCKVSSVKVELHRLLTRAL